VRGDRDDRNMRRGRVCLDPPGGLPAVEDRQSQVHEHDVGLLGGGERDALLAVGGDENREPGPFEAAPEHVDVAVVVLHVQELHFAALPSAAGCAGAPGTDAGASTRCGKRMVKVEPRPGVLATVMSPPIIRQKRWLMARPSPVPPYWRAVVASAWENSWN